jgi:hypothetical protein
MTEPITITVPSNEELLLQAKMRGQSASGNFPLEEGKQYILALVRTSDAIVPDNVVQAIADLTDVEAAFRIGDYITETGVPEGKQIEAQVRVKIRLGNVPEQVVVEP